MKGLSDRQIEFCDRVAHDERTIDALMKDFGLSTREFAEWDESRPFRAMMRVVARFLAFQRECDVRRGAVEYTRRMRQGQFGEPHHFSPAHARAGRILLAHARQADREFLEKYLPPFHPKAVNPIHPAFARQAPKLLAQMEALQRRATEIRAGRTPGNFQT